MIVSFIIGYVKGYNEKIIEPLSDEQIALINSNLKNNENMLEKKKRMVEWSRFMKN